MGLSNRGGNWHYRFWAAGRRWTGNTGLAATERNRSAALLKEAEIRKMVLEGRSDNLHLEVRTFSDAADQFIEWAEGEHHSKPQTWKRLRGSMTSLREFFKKQPLHTISLGQIQDYMAWRRGMGIKEVSLRHDLHAMSPLFKYGIAHNWCRENPVTSENLRLHGAKMPSDGDAVRIHVLTAAEEMLYFDGCLRPPERITVKSEAHTQTRRGKRVSVSAYKYSKLVAREYRDLHDVARLMLLQGPRPAEVMQTRVEHVNLEQGTWFIPKSKSASGKRTLRLTAAARAILSARVASAPSSGWLFPGKTRGSHLMDVENAHKAVLESRGLAFVLYDLRHTFATRFYQATKDVVALKEVLGHSNLRTIMKYVHVSREHVDGAMKVYEASLCQSGANDSAKDTQSEQTSENERFPSNTRIE
jgi:integrase